MTAVLSPKSSGAGYVRFAALRSALYNVIQWVSVALFVPAAMPFVAPLPLRWRFRVLSQWARFQIWLLRVLCRLDYRVEGLEHLPGGPAIILAKHQSAWETIAFQQIFPPQTWVLKRELMWIPIFGWGLALLKPIAIDRGAGRRAVQQVIDQGRERLESGIWIVVFPEGTRVAVGRQRRFGIGGAALAAGTGYPVVPVAHNAGMFWPRHGFRKRAGTVRVVVGPTIDSRGRSAEEINRVAVEWMTHAMTELEGRPPVSVGTDSKK